MDKERLWIVKASFTLTAGCFIFFLVAPSVLNYPLDYDQVIRLLQVILPVFIGYLGLAAAYLFASNLDPPELPVKNDHLLRILTRGPVFMFALGIFTVVIVFWYSNRPQATPGSGMTIDQLSWFITALLGLLTATTGVVVARVFPVERGGNRD